MSVSDEATVMRSSIDAKGPNQMSNGMLYASSLKHLQESSMKDLQSTGVKAVQSQAVMEKLLEQDEESKIPFEVRRGTAPTIRERVKTSVKTRSRHQGSNRTATCKKKYRKDLGLERKVTAHFGGDGSLKLQDPRASDCMSS